jgi:hypothetical protein
LLEAGDEQFLELAHERQSGLPLSTLNPNSRIPLS